MVEATVRYGRDTWAGEHKPAARHNAASRLRLSNATNYGGYAYVYLKSPVPPGQTVLSAKLQIFVANTDSWAGTKTLTVRRIADSWKAGKLNWNNKPGVFGSNQPTVTVTDAKDGQLLEFDVTPHVQHVADGSFHYGWRIETDSTTAHRIYGFASDNPPRLVVSFSDPPSAPTDLVPAGGAVSVAKPVFSFSATDLANPGEISAIRVQVDPAASETAPAFDSGWVSKIETDLDPTDLEYTWAGLADGASTQWRAWVKNADGVESDPSEWVSFSRTSKGTLTITNPAAAPNNYVSESTPPILATSSVALDSAEVLIVDPADHADILADSGPFDMAGGTSISWTPPAGIIHDGESYTAIVRGTDQVDRVATAGDPVYVEAVQDFTFNEDTTVAAPGSLTATQSSNAPGVQLTWQRATAPDSWTILRDGKNIASDVDPADTTAGGTSHTWTDIDATPGKQHTYAVRAVVNGRASAKSNTATITFHSVGVWVVDIDRGLSFKLTTLDVADWKMVDDVALYSVIGSDRQVQVHVGLRGLEGSCTGDLEDIDGGRTLASMLDDLYAIKARPDRTVRIVATDLAIPAKLRNLSVAPHPAKHEARDVRAVSFEFFQAGGLPFKMGH